MNNDELAEQQAAAAEVPEFEYMPSPMGNRDYPPPSEEEEEEDYEITDERPASKRVYNTCPVLLAFAHLIHHHTIFFENYLLFFIGYYLNTCLCF
jgi:hypothetical protein